MRMLVLAVVVAVVAAHAGVSSAASIDIPETFGDGGAPAANGWTFNMGGVVADAGELGAGDHANQYTNNTGFHMLHPMAGATPNSTFLGNYTAAGVQAIVFRARHSGVGDTVNLRATLFDDFGDGIDWAVSNSVVTITPNDTSWQTYGIAIQPGDLFAGGNNLHSVTDILADVAQVGLRHDPAGTGPNTQSFVSQETSVFFDDITLIGIPTPGALVLFACFAVVGGRRRMSSALD